MKSVKNRWLIALSAVGIHISIGSVYSWSIFSKPLIKMFDWNLKDVSLTFSIAIIFLGLSAALWANELKNKDQKKPLRSPLASLERGLSAPDFQYC